MPRVYRLRLTHGRILHPARASRSKSESVRGPSPGDPREKNRGAETRSGRVGVDAKTPLDEPCPALPDGCISSAIEATRKAEACGTAGGARHGWSGACAHVSRQRRGALSGCSVAPTAQFVAGGAAVDVSPTVTCNATGTADVSVVVTQRRGSHVVRGFGFSSVTCTGSAQTRVVRVTSGSEIAFKPQRTNIVASADLFGCDATECRSETDSELIQIVK